MQHKRIIFQLFMLWVVFAIIFVFNYVSAQHPQSSSEQIEKIKRSWIEIIFGPINLDQFKRAHQIAYFENTT